MQHILFARFDREGDAAAAASELEAIEPRGELEVRVHRRPLDELPSSELRSFETAGMTMTVRGTLIGAILGAVGGGLALGPLMAGLPLFMAVAYGLWLGVICGAFGGAVAGSSGVEPAARQLGPHGPMLSVACDSLDLRARAEDVIARHHGHAVRRSVRRDLFPWSKDAPRHA